MYEYFPDDYAWSLAVVGSLNLGGNISEMDDALRAVRQPFPNRAAAMAAWSGAWTALAQKVERLGDVDFTRGAKRAAGHKYRRAVGYYLTAERHTRSDDPRRLDIYKSALSTFRRSVELLREKVEFVEVPSPDGPLPALFVHAENAAGPTPCIVHFDGFDVMKEHIYLRRIAQDLSARGVSVLIVDHPGVGEALRLRGMKMIPEAERPASACVDYLLTRSDVDAKRIGMMAVSLGGYHAPRAAAFEKRFACCVAWGGAWDYGAISRARAARAGTQSSVSDWEDHAKWVFGVDTIEAALAITDRMTLAGVMDKVTCPVLIAHGENDRQIPAKDAVAAYEAAVNSSRRELKIFTRAEGGAEHCMGDNLQNGVDYMADWIAQVLGAAR